MSKAEKYIFSCIQWHTAHGITLLFPCGNAEGGGEDIQDMLQKWIMQDTFNQEPGFLEYLDCRIGCDLVGCLFQNLMWWGERKEKSDSAKSSLQKKCQPEENLSRVVLDISCQKILQWKKIL